MKSETQKKIRALKRFAIVVGFLLCLALIVYIAYSIVTSPQVRYWKATRWMDKDVIKSYELLIELEDYKDSAEKADSLYEEYKVKKLHAAEVGDYVRFGAYEQDNDTSNGNEIIEWLVLDKQDNKVLVISKYALDCKKYNESYMDMTWKDCTLREWLNSTFMDSAFSHEEKGAIVSTVIPNPDNLEFNTLGGGETTDQMFILNIDEANQYFNSDQERQCISTAYAMANGAHVYSGYKELCWWWLRSPGGSQQSAARVHLAGGIREYGYNVAYAYTAVRPAMWIDLDAVK